MEGARIQDFNAFTDEYLFRPYDCVRLMLMAYSDVIHLTPEVCDTLGRQFRTGLGYKGTCGALTASCMVLGLMGQKESPAWLVDGFKAACGSCDCRDIMPVGGRDYCMKAIKTAYRLMAEHAAFEMPQDFTMEKAFQGAYVQSEQ